MFSLKLDILLVNLVALAILKYMYQVLISGNIGYFTIIYLDNNSPDKTLR